MSFGDPKTDKQYPNVPAPEHLVPDLENQGKPYLAVNGQPGVGVQPKSDNNPDGTAAGIWTGVMTAKMAAWLSGGQSA